MNDTLIVILRGVFLSIPTLLIMAACIYFVTKIRSTGPILMLIGISISFILSIYYNFIYYLDIRSSGIDSVLEFGKLQSILGTVGTVAYITIAAGLFIFVINVVRKKTNSPSLSERINNI